MVSNEKHSASDNNLPHSLCNLKRIQFCSYYNFEYNSLLQKVLKMSALDYQKFQNTCCNCNHGTRNAFSKLISCLGIYLVHYICLLVKFNRFRLWIYSFANHDLRPTHTQGLYSSVTLVRLCTIPSLSRFETKYKHSR